MFRAEKPKAEKANHASRESPRLSIMLRIVLLSLRLISQLQEAFWLLLNDFDLSKGFFPVSIVADVIEASNRESLYRVSNVRLSLFVSASGWFNYFSTRMAVSRCPQSKAWILGPSASEVYANADEFLSLRLHFVSHPMSRLISFQMKPRPFNESQFWRWKHFVFALRHNSLLSSSSSNIAGYDSLRTPRTH